MAVKGLNVHSSQEVLGVVDLDIQNVVNIQVKRRIPIEMGTE